MTMQAISNLMGEMKYFDDIRARNCPTIFEEISEYQPVPQPRSTPEMLKVRNSRANKQMRDEEYEKFWGQEENRQWLECRTHPRRAECGCKYHVEFYNASCYARLCELARECVEKDLIPEQKAVMAKHAQFARVIREYPEKPLRIFTVPELTKNYKAAAEQARDEKSRVMDYLNQ